MAMWTLCRWRLAELLCCVIFISLALFRDTISCWSWCMSKTLTCESEKTFSLECLYRARSQLAHRQPDAGNHAHTRQRSNNKRQWHWGAPGVCSIHAQYSIISAFLGRAIDNNRQSQFPINRQRKTKINQIIFRYRECDERALFMGGWRHDNHMIGRPCQMLTNFVVVVVVAIAEYIFFFFDAPPLISWVKGL